jgi:hypothetical protein
LDTDLHGFTLLILWHESAYTEPYLLLAGYLIWAKNAINGPSHLGDRERNSEQLAGKMVEQVEFTWQDSQGVQNRK